MSSLRGAGAAPCACAERVGEAAGEADTCAVIVAGGTGERFGDPRGKQFVDLCGLPLLCWSLVAFDRSPSVGRIVVACAPERFGEVREDVLSRVALSKPVELAPSGPTRQDTVFQGLSRVPLDFPLVAVHDAARPLVEPEAVERAVRCVREDATLAGAILASRAVDTLKLVEGSQIVSTPDRAFYWAAQTPQVFRLPVLLEAHEAARREGFRGTDDSSLVERQGGRVLVVESSRDNIKVTLPEDLAVAEAALERRLVEAGLARPGEGGTHDG